MSAHVGVVSTSRQTTPTRSRWKQYMGWLKCACPPMYAALMARHRGICRERKDVQGMRRHAERYYASCLLEDSSPAGVQRFRRLCDQGYCLYRDGAGQAAGSRAIT
jgi:hypothetical protein